MVLVPARRDLDPATVDGVWWGTEEMGQFRTSAAKFFLAQDSSAGSGDDSAALSAEKPDKEGDGGKTLPERIGDSSAVVTKEDVA